MPPPFRATCSASISHKGGYVAFTGPNDMGTWEKLMAEIAAEPEQQALWDQEDGDDGQ